MDVSRETKLSLFKTEKKMYIMKRNVKWREKEIMRTNECVDQSQAGACGFAFSASFYTHATNTQLVCGDVNTFDACVRNISCLAEAQKNDQINQIRTLVTNQQGITCRMY
ncbi:unnamed protein product [Lymnaea stagnalis]|uniref:Uncharacterized protein n=1 Tax=Lymnaea stagnalis TaxID=6523 RepID=A0AAV2I9K6_LYMST